MDNIGLAVNTPVKSVCSQGLSMDVFGLSLLIWLGSFLAGFLRALTGLGGGVVIIPLLTLGFGVDIGYAIGASLVSVIATSSASAAAYVKKGFADLRVRMFLEIATTMGQLPGFPSQPEYQPQALQLFSGLCSYTLRIKPSSLARKEQTK